MPVSTTIILTTNDAGVQPIFGQTAINRLIQLSYEFNISKIYLISNEKGIFDANSVKKPFPAPLIVENAEDLQKAAPLFDISDHDRILVMNAGLVIDRSLLKKFIDTDDGAGVAAISAYGEGESRGAYLVSCSDLLKLLKNLCNMGMSDQDANQSIQRLVTHHLKGADGLPYVMPPGQKQIEMAEKRLVQSLGRQTHASDSLISRHFDRHISRAISTRLSRTPLAPNHITLMGVAIGMLGAYLLSLPGYFYQLVGAFLFLFCVIVDGVDGEVARLKLQDSVFGHYLDVITDNLVHVAVFVGMAYGLHRGSGDPIYLQALWLMLGGFGLCIIAVWQCILRRSEEELARSPRVLRLMALMTNRDFAYLVFLLALIDRLNWFLLGAAIGTYVFALTLWGLSYFEKKSTAPKTP